MGLSHEKDKCKSEIVNKAKENHHLKINISKTIFFLLTSLFTRKEKDPERIVIKGIKTTQQMIEDVKSEIESIKPDKSNEAGNVRTNILKKLQEEIKK